MFPESPRHPSLRPSRSSGGFVFLRERGETSRFTEQALAAALRGRPLRELSLADNSLGDSGTAAIAGLLEAEGSALKELNLSENRFGVPGVQHLARALSVPLQLFLCERR